MHFSVEMMIRRPATRRRAMQTVYEPRPSEPMLRRALCECVCRGGALALHFERNEAEGRLRRLEMQAQHQRFAAWAREFDRPQAYGDGVMLVHPAGGLAVETVVLLEGGAERLPALLARFVQARRLGRLDPLPVRRYLVDALAGPAA